MSKGLVTIVVTGGADSITCNVGSLTRIDYKEAKAPNSENVLIRAYQYVWNGNGTPTITVHGGGMTTEWSNIVKLA